jgi:hypothetical protein
VPEPCRWKGLKTAAQTVQIRIGVDFNTALVLGCQTLFVALAPQRRLGRLHPVRPSPLHPFQLLAILILGVLHRVLLQAANKLFFGACR